ncbi:hypothetical protein [Streptomyces cucumeris]|uniref:hypothetical protein n=1 Tax=Streptomyces cucumeris TaxID=2962890 RepID=UPI0020C8807D|nr:hypothetical protein [Streptomyces sp. NEAU-Y11]MCP9211388.1 hypothetical protein [Streptomyces sp. NEAU-Y11]
MGMRGRSYQYVGPAELKGLVRPEAMGRQVCSAADLRGWASARTSDELAEPFTFVVDTTGVLRLAPRHSEHVVCAGGEAVLSAGEMSFREESGRWVVDEVSNQSTGYCPDIGSWAAVGKALDRAGIASPSGFSHEVIFRGCPGCQQLNIVRDEHFVCVFCDTTLPLEWNVDVTA